MRNVLLRVFGLYIAASVWITPSVFSQVQPSFESQGAGASANWGGNVFMSDVNNDGNSDLIIGGSNYEDLFPDHLYVHLGNGTGAFGPGFHLENAYGGNGGSRVAVAQLNSGIDSHPDIATCGEGGMIIYYGLGTGQFGAGNYIPFESSPSTVQCAPYVGDFDEDGFEDILLRHNYTSQTQASIRFGAPTGLSTRRVHTPIFSSWFRLYGDLAVGDINNDGDLDFILTEPYNPNYQFTWVPTVYLGDGSGGFEGVEAYPLQYAGDAYRVRLADLNRDGNLDLITRYNVHLGDGSGTFGPPIDTLPLGGFIQYKFGHRVGDVNGDGHLDLVAESGFFLGDGTGQLGDLVPFVLEGQNLVVNGQDVNGQDHALSDVNNDNRLDIVVGKYASGYEVFLNTTPYQTATGSNIEVEVGNANFTFDSVQLGGTTTVNSIDPATAGDVPGGFALADVAFEVSTNATFSGEVTSCFTVNSVNVEADFLALRVLHNENGTLVDRTSSHDYAARKICATTTSFSPFYLARLGNTAEYLFDRSKAFKSGSTIPIKLRLESPGGQNISSPNTPLYVRSLRKIGANTTSAVNDPGQSNPDYQFRFVDGQYQYNFKTSGLVAGKYVLSYFAGADTTFFYTVTFELR